jgi:polyisoprenoid-binding protein YceI
MVRNMKILPLSAALLAVCLAPVYHAGAQTRYTTQPVGNSIKIDGTSSMHDWEMEGGLIGGFIELGAGVTLDKAQTNLAGLQGDKVPAKAHVIIPVGSMHSKADHLPGVMDDLMKKAMKEGDFPRIEYKLTEMTFKGPHAAGKPFDFDTKGELAIAGKTNKVSFPVTMEPLDGGKLKVTGVAPLKMTDFGVEPPAPNFGLGMMKCGDGVKIIFDWTLKEKK